MLPSELDELKSISQRISLNLPESAPWRWDNEHNLALTVIDRQDEIMVGLPLNLEFSQAWDFISINDADAYLRDFFNNDFGIIPGQKVFTSEPVDDVVLYAAWWPWGDNERISIRLGLVSTSGAKLPPQTVKKLMCRWLRIV